VATKRVVAWALGVILGISVGLPLVYLGAAEVNKVYQQHQFLRSFFMKCAKHEPFVMGGRAYGCILAPLEQFMGEQQEETPDKSKA
jgi:hypothetical protein